MARSMGAIKTSVVIPVYNTEEWLPACLDSVLAQTQSEIEVILVDDGSTDGSLDIERTYAERDARIRVLRQQNLRQGTARNRGLAEARGEFVYFMDSDDLIVPELFEVCYRACTEDDLDFVTFDTAGFRDDPEIEQPELFSEVRDRSGIVGADIVDGVSFWTAYHNRGALPYVCWLSYFRRDFLEANDLRFVERIYFEDNDWTVRVFLAAQRVRYLPLKLHRYRDRPGSNVHAGFSHVLAEACFDVYEALLSLLELQGDPQRQLVVRQAASVLSARFEQFGSIDPSDDLRKRTEGFAERMRNDASDAGREQTVRLMDLEMLCALAKGVRAWKGFPLIGVDDLYEPVLLAGVHRSSGVPRIGVYGVGNAGRLFMELVREYPATWSFFDSEPEPGREFLGHEVLPIREAAGCRLDGMIITSSKYSSTMLARVHEVLGDDVPTTVIPWRILAFHEYEANERRS